MIIYFTGDRGAGKSAELIKRASVEINPLIIQPHVHWIEDGKVWSRNGKEMPCITVTTKDKLTPLIGERGTCYIDEVMMLSNAQLDELERSKCWCYCFGLFDMRVVNRAKIMIRL